MPIDPRQYDSAIDFIDDDANFNKSMGNITNNDDRLRYKAYELYEDMYNNRPEHMRVVQRGEDEDSVEIYLPSAKKNIEAVNRFFAVDFDFFVDPTVGSADDQKEATDALNNLFAKQHFMRKFNQMKRYMLMKGDACFHITGQKWERAGKRICIEELKPEHYFPIENLVTGQLEGCHVVDVIRNPRTTPNTQRYSPDFVARRQTYRLVMDENDVPTGRVTSELSLWEVGRWDDRIPTVRTMWVDTIIAAFPLPESITHLPVYHFANNPPPGSTFGMSELAGNESLITAINQAISDEDLTLITQGLGVYWTDSSAPVDASGAVTEWEIGPGSVVEIGAGGKFGRVSGISSVTPYLEHILAMDESMQQSIGVPDIAIGMVDVATAESGIALELKLRPLLAKNAEKEIDLTQLMDELLEDLVMEWLPAYEALVIDEVLVTTAFGDPLPKNTSQLLQDVLGIWGTMENILPIAWIFDQLNNIMGYGLTESDFDQALQDQLKEAKIQAEIAKMMAAAVPAPANGAATSTGGSPSGQPTPGSKPKGPGSGIAQIDNLTKFSQSEKLQKTQARGATGQGSVSAALAGGEI